MNAAATFKVQFDRTLDGQPLATIDGGPFVDLTRTPAQLRQLAMMLIRVANAAEARPTTGRHWAPGHAVLTEAGDDTHRDPLGFPVSAPAIGEGWVAPLPSEPNAH